MVLKPFSALIIPKIIVEEVIIVAINIICQRANQRMHKLLFTLRKLNVLDQGPNFRKADMYVFK